MTTAAPQRRSAIVSYSHTETDWTDKQAQERLQQVHRFVFALRAEGGIEADADIFHQNEDWTRWGPQQVQNCDFVLVIASPAWRDAWMATGDPKKNKGVRAEADVVRSIQADGHDVLQKRVRLIMLPGSTDADIPAGMHGINRHRINGFELADLEPLLRDLTDQPMFVKPPVGDVPVFPPAMTTHTPDVERLETAGPDAQPPTQKSSDADRDERIEQLREQLDALPAPLPGEGPHLPWFRLRQQIETLLHAELDEAPSTSDSPASVVPSAGSTWAPVGNVDLKWVEEWQPGLAYQQSAAVLHLLPVPQTPVSQRLMSSMDGTLSDLLFQAGRLKLGQGFEKRFPGDDVVIELEVPRYSSNEIDLGHLLGCRVNRSGQVSIWFSLPRDHMGSVLDQERLASDLTDGLALGIQILDATQGNSFARVAVAAELVNLTLLTNGTLDQLGRRSSANLPWGYGRGAPRLKPDESVTPAALRSTAARGVAATVAQVLIQAATS